MNSIYFWAEPEHGLHELRRVLASGRRLVVAAEDRAVPRAIAEFGFRVYSDAKLERLLRGAGFSAVRCERRGIQIFAIGEKRRRIER